MHEAERLHVPVDPDEIAEDVFFVLESIDVHELWDRSGSHSDGYTSPEDMAMETERQGQFLAYIHQYSIVNGRAPAEADMQQFFRITPPSVHAMVLTLERRGLIRRVPGMARSITLIVSPESLPALKRIQVCCEMT